MSGKGNKKRQLKEDINRLVRKLLFPGTKLVILSIPLSAVLLAYSFTLARKQGAEAYASYIISAYSLTIFCTAVIPGIKGKVKNFLRRNTYINRYFEEISFRLKVSLYSSFGINMFYAGVNGFAGMYYSSVWSGTLAAYYIILSVVRFLLVKYSHKYGFGENQRAEWKRYRLCGIFLMIMNIALAGVVILILKDNRSFEYDGVMIYVMAMFTFYITVMAIVNIIKYRKYNSPVMSAVRAAGLTSALVSMLALETAMVTQFDDGSNALWFRYAMTGATGGGVCTAVIITGLYMTVHASKMLKKINVIYEKERRDKYEQERRHF